MLRVCICFFQLLFTSSSMLWYERCASLRMKSCNLEYMYVDCSVPSICFGDTWVFKRSSSCAAHDDPSQGTNTHSVVLTSALAAYPYKTAFHFASPPPGSQSSSLPMKLLRDLWAFGIFSQGCSWRFKLLPLFSIGFREHLKELIQWSWFCWLLQASLYDAPVAFMETPRRKAPAGGFYFWGRR